MREHAIAATTRVLVTPANTRQIAAADSARRKIARYVAALASVTTGALYVLIATGTLQVIDPAVKGEQAPIFIPIAAAAAYILGTILVLAFDRRIVQVLGLAVQFVTIIGYFAVAPNRTPSYEIWGIAIKILQVVTLIALTYLVVRTPRRIRTGK